MLMKPITSSNNTNKKSTKSSTKLRDRDERDKKKKKKPNLSVKKMLPRRERKLDVVVHWFGSKRGGKSSGIESRKKRRRWERDADKEERENAGREERREKREETDFFRIEKKEGKSKIKLF